MANRRVLETKVEEGLPYDINRGVYVNKESVISTAQYGTPSKIYPLFLMIVQSQKIKAFDLPDELPPLPVSEEVGHSPNLLDFQRWVDAIDCIEDAMFAVQVGKTIFNRLPDSYKQKASEVV